MNSFKTRRRCSNAGENCSRDDDCLQSCDFGEIPAENMVCYGSNYEKQRNMGKCYASIIYEGTQCAIGNGPGPHGDNPCKTEFDNSLYCQQTTNWDPNLSPSFSLPQVGQGYCRKKVNFWNV